MTRHAGAFTVILMSRKNQKSSVATILVPLIVAGVVLMIALLAASRKTEIRSRAAYEATSICTSLCSDLPSRERGSCLLKCPRVSTGEYRCTDVCLSIDANSQVVTGCYNKCRADIMPPVPGGGPITVECGQLALECEDIKVSKANTLAKDQLLYQVLTQMNEIGCKDTSACTIR